jgi:hypothetical protein
VTTETRLEKLREQRAALLAEQSPLAKVEDQIRETEETLNQERLAAAAQELEAHKKTAARLDKEEISNWDAFCAKAAELHEAFGDWQAVGVKREAAFVAIGSAEHRQALEPVFRPTTEPPRTLHEALDFAIGAEVIQGPNFGNFTGGVARFGAEGGVLPVLPAGGQ